MKNLIVTMGILHLMTMGILYETDCLHMILKQRQLMWICGEMADCAAQCCEVGQSMNEAKNAAENILRRNSSADEMENMVWDMEKAGNTIRVKVVSPSPDFCLFFLEHANGLTAYKEKEILS